MGIKAEMVPRNAFSRQNSHFEDSDDVLANQPEKGYHGR